MTLKRLADLFHLLEHLCLLCFHYKYKDISNENLKEFFRYYQNAVEYLFHQAFPKNLHLRTISIFRFLC